MKKKTHSKHLSEVGIGVIQYFHRLELSGELTAAAAKSFASNALKSATYGTNGYFWINSGEGILLMQPYTPKRVGVNQIEWTDMNNKYVFKDFIREAKEGVVGSNTIGRSPAPGNSIQKSHMWLIFIPGIGFSAQGFIWMT